MTYRQPAFMTNNLISGITDPLTALVTRSGPALIASSQRAFVDGRAGSVGFHGSTGSFAGVTIDLGGTLSVAPNRAVIPERDRQITLSVYGSILGMVVSSEHFRAYVHARRLLAW